MNQYLTRICLIGILLYTELFVLAVTLNPLATKNILGNQGSSTQLSFRAPLGVDASLISCEWEHNGNTISIDGNKYVLPTPRSLKINNIIGDDEGNYACDYYYNQIPYSETVACINVIGVAAFAQPQENLSTHVGGTAQFDTRVTFIGGGSQQHKQKVNLLQLYKDGRQVFRCRNWNSYATLPCTSEGRFAVDMQGSDKFDFYLSLSNVTVNDGGRYEVRLEVIHPETGSYSQLRKAINLTVTDPPQPPVVSIKARGEPNPGEAYSLWCNVALRGSSVVENLSVSWWNPSGVMIKSTTTNTSLGITFNYLSQTDEGVYTCGASVSIQGSQEPLTANATMKVTLNVVSPDVESFQLCIGPFFLSDCSALAVDSQKGLQLESEIRNEIVRNVMKRCSRCASVSSDLIQPGKLRCSETAARLIYRSTIETTGSHNASEIVQVIKEWVNSTEPGQATLHLWPFVMDLDSRCPVSITSLDSPYPTLSAGGSQVQFSRVKESIDSCLSLDNLQPKNI